MRIIKYLFLSCEIDHGTGVEQIFLEKSVPYSEAAEELARAEAYNGEYTIEDDTLEVVLPLGMTLLWENATPTSEFAEQTLAIDWTPYDIIEVDLGSVSIAFEAKVNRSVTPGTVIRADSGTVGGCYREVKLVDGGIYIDDARSHRGSAWAHDTNALRPLRIYGIKGVIE